MRVGALIALAAALVAACATPPPPDASRQLVPGGKLRVGLLYGNPALVRLQDGQPTGIAVDLARALARDLGAEFVPVGYQNAVAVLDSAVRGEWDVAFIAYDPARTQVRFATPYMELENTLLVTAKSPIQDLAEMDARGRRIVVQSGDSADLYLTRTLKQARLVRTTHAAAPGMLERGEVDAYAANRLRLTEVAPTVPGTRVLPGRFLALPQTIAVPPDRDAALVYLNGFVARAKASGEVQRAIDRAGVAGAVVAP
jgi:polar amino acid transport system substrate-binding protein